MLLDKQLKTNSLIRRLFNMSQQRASRSEYNTIEWTNYVFRFIRFTGFFVHPYDVIHHLRPSTMVIIFLSLASSSAILAYSWSSFDIHHSSIIYIGNQLTANSVISITIFTIIFYLRFRREVYNAFLLLDKTDQLVSSCSIIKYSIISSSV